ncbi:nucleoporin complex subunit 54-domain-containing protein [Apiospora arundinis]|uniref:Nucleoporin complex subunit 54-domain-containing protein n=1 Tax=Apiospora arundinis TaxID=335852 RepID=A0ABR2HTW0_9PEZI
MSLFGSQPAQSTGFGQQNNTSSVFGQPAASTNTGSSVFGQALGQQQQQQQQQPQQQAQQSTNAFATSSLFGQPQQQQQQQQPQQSSFATGSPFQPLQQQQQQQQIGQQQQQQGQQPQLGNSTQQNFRTSLWQPGQDSTHQKPITEQCVSIFQKWNPTSPDTVFKHYFYNKVDEAQVPFYQPGPNEDPREWEQAVRDKPGAGYVPVLATGFMHMAERLKSQRINLSQLNNALHQINSSLDAILSKHDLETSVRALNAKRKHALLRQRCIAIAAKVQVLRNRGYALDTDEDELKSKLEALDRGLADPSLSARNEELWSRLIMLRNHADTLRDEINQRGGVSGDGISEEAEARAKKLLEDYDKQLQALKGMVEKVKEDYDEWEKERNPTASDAR